MFNRFSSHYVNLIACGVYIAFLSDAFLLRLTWRSPILIGLLEIALATALFALIFNYWRYLKIAEAPISTIAGAAQGYIELNGIASTAEPMRSPLHGVPCVWFRAWTYAADGNHMFRLLSFVQSNNAILLNDGTGKCSVNPKNAEVIYVEKRTSNHNDHRYVEEYLIADKPLYLLGNLDTRQHISDPKVIHAETGKLLSEWRKNTPKLLFRFDQNLNGKIDENEWEAARLAARKEVEARHQTLAHLGEFEISAPKNGQLFILSGLSPDRLRASHRCWILTHLAILTGLIFAI